MTCYRGALILVLLPGLFGAPARAQLLHRYNFQTAGSASDIVGTANGTIYGTATVVGGALNTSGVIGGLSGGVPQNCVGLPAAAVAGLTNAFSLEIWFAASASGPWCTAFSFSDGTTANYVLATPVASASPVPSRVEVVGGGGSTSYQDVYQIYCDDSTVHDMIVTYNGTNLSYYLDGTLSIYSNFTNSVPDRGLNLSTLTNIGIAGGSPYADDTINGQVFDFRIYGQALNLTQVGAIYALGTNTSNGSISNALDNPIPFGQTPSTGNLVRLPFYGSPYLHDPGTLRQDGTNYFIFGDGTGILCIASSDLRNWSAASAVFPTSPPAWTTNNVSGGTPNYFWAPDTAYFNGLWHVYYAYSQWGTINSAIGVATSPSLVSPAWTDLGKVVESNSPSTTNTDTTAYNCIDPSIFVAANGTVWMAYGSYSSGILVTPINPATGLRLNPDSVGTQVANNAVGGGWGSTEEGSCIYQRGGYWYLFANWGGCCDGTYSTYNIRVGRGTRPAGPYYDRNGVNLNSSGGTMFLESTARYIGPGHAAIFPEATGTNWFTFHFYDGLNNGEPTVGMEQLYWSADGWPVMTNDWSVLYPLSANANESSGAYNGSLQNHTGFTNDPVRGSVLFLDGVTNCVSLPLSVGNASTFAAWVNWRGGVGWQRIFDFGNDTTNYFFLTPAASTGDLRFAITTSGPGGEQQINVPFAFPTDSWHHVAVTLNGGADTGILYLDGAPIATNSSLTLRPWQTTPHNNNIGKSQFATDPFFAGEISSFRIFGRALSAAEIGALSQVHPALAHRYSFRTNNPAIWDSVGMAHGTLMGGAVVTNNTLDLTSTNQSYANLPPGLVTGSSAVTLEFWATFGTNSSWARVFDTGNIVNGNGQNYFFYSPHSGNVPAGQRLQVSGTHSTATLDITGTLDSLTVHVDCICDPANNYLAVYTNGVLEASYSGSVPGLNNVASDWSFIGRSLFSTDAYVNATINEFRLYDGRLTPQQIAANDFAGPASLPIITSTNATSVALTTRTGALTLTWPADHTGWRLQVQTNTPVTGLGTNWLSVPGSSTTNAIILPIGLASQCTFYRLAYP